MSDLISRQVAIDAILHNKEVYSNNFGDDPIDKYTIAIIDNDAQTIAQLPSAERKGKWMVIHDHNFADTYKCSVCGERPIVDLYGEYVLSFYCPACGAKMRKEE